eukprot:15364497-Ditylum_brightwellii.AAC.1
MEIIPLLLPEDPGDNTGMVASALFKEEIKECVKETKELKKAHKITWGQCSKAMQVKLHGDPKYKDFNKQRDIIMILESIKAAMQKFNHWVEQYMSMCNTIKRFWTLYQGKDMSNLVFLECFNAIVDVVEGQGGVIAFHTSLVTLEGEDDEAIETSRDKFLARCFIQKACRGRYNRLTE